MRKFLALLLVISLSIFAFAMPANALSSANDDVLKDHMLRILVSVEHEKELYGLKDVRFDSVSIGKEIPAYVVENQQLINANAHVFPVLCENQLVSMFFCMYLPSGELYVQLGTELVPFLAPYVSNDAFAIIYDDFGVHVLINNKIIMITENPILQDNCESNTSTIHSASQGEPLNSVNNLNRSLLETVKTEKLIENFNLDAHKYILKMRGSIPPTTAYLNVDILSQPQGTSYCWALCSAAIVNYVNSTNYSYSDILLELNYGWDTAMSAPNVISLLNQYYGINYRYVGNGNPSMATVLNALSRGKPIYCGFEYPNENTHAVVLRGANQNARTFSVMNPVNHTTGYTAGTVSNSNVWTFYCAQSNLLMTMIRYGIYNG